jgi:hypothetical protein
VYTARVFEAVNRANIRVVERGQELCFALEAREAVDIKGESVT